MTRLRACLFAAQSSFFVMDRAGLGRRGRRTSAETNEGLAQPARGLLRAELSRVNRKCNPWKRPAALSSTVAI